MSRKTVAARIEARIHVIRGERVMLDADLAALYGVATSAVNLAVRRNPTRFPPDFMFQLTRAEAANLIFQSEISSSRGYGGRRTLPYAFTEQGVAMLSSVLRSERAVAVNILIMRTFVQLRRTFSQTTELGHRVDEIEQRIESHDAVLGDILNALRALERPTPQKRREIGFRTKT
ncbi:MAG TPA: ORF6N domain-containing protein [Candidatus Limnocylindria bacterium]|nr:ORF6N domain-containing protein [Candidatus Limnocylindria bacterium]